MSIYTSQSLESVKGVGAVSLEKLRKAGIESKFDLINFFPRDYQSVNYMANINQVRPGQITIKAKAKNIKLKQTNRVTTILSAELYDDSGAILGVWFNQPYRANQLKSGQFYFSGRFEFARGRYQLTNPSVQMVSRENEELSSDHIRPIYSQVRGLKSSFFDKVIDNLKPDILTLNESMPQVVIDELELMSRSDSLYQLHFPTKLDLIYKAKWREQVEEYFIAGLASAINGLKQNKQLSESIEADIEIIKKFVDKLPFRLTDDQRKAIWKIIQKLSNNHPMNLLLQGDVGSGKTVVAEIVSLAIVKAGHQVAFMAPTEILATQHFNKISQNLASFGVKVALLTSSIKGKERKEIYAELESGKLDIVIGTHALIQESVKFKKLALAVIDEQHRFGVAQRQKLLTKADKMPHLLSMTATPIPRSLALTIKNELEILSIKQKPVGRLPIETYIYTDKHKDEVYAKIIAELQKGRQGYIVCGLIEEDEDDQIKSVSNIYKKLSKNEFKDYKLAILHGKLKSEEKAKIMQDFLDKKIDVLIATTVVEVGVDVPNATVMMIEDADNYGLSQLHQLRGRIGRSEHQSFCYLISSNDGSNERLQAIASSEDGFYLSEIDLKMRGMGSFYGKEQSGWFNLEANIDAIKTANRGVKIFLDWLKSNNKDLESELENFPELNERIGQFDQITVLN